MRIQQTGAVAWPVTTSQRLHVCTDYGYEVDYTRVPVTDEKAPKEKDFALLMRRLWRPPEGAALIFNCQMGRGRTSTGMIIASLLQLRRRLKSVEMPSEPQGEQVNDQQ